MKLHLVLGFAVLCTAIACAETLEQNVSKSATIDDLVEVLWTIEAECPFPQYKMAREALGIDPTTLYSIPEKANLIYRAKELRRGMNLVLKNEREQAIRKGGAKSLQTGNPTLENYSENFHKTSKGKKMVEYLNNKVITAKEFVNYLAQEENVAAARNGRKSVDFISGLSTKEKINALYQREMGKKQAKAKKREAGKKKAQASNNEASKPPMKPYRVNPKAIGD